jgi:hypothetical protein
MFSSPSSFLGIVYMRFIAQVTKFFGGLYMLHKSVQSQVLDLSIIFFSRLLDRSFIIITNLDHDNSFFLTPQQQTLISCIINLLNIYLYLDFFKTIIHNNL